MRQNVRLAVGFLLLIAIFLGFAHWLWLKLFFMNSETVVRELARSIGPAIAAGEPVNTNLYRNFIAREPDTGYVVVADYRNGRKNGITNTTTLRNSASSLEDYLRRFGEDAMLARIVQPGGGFPGEYLHVVSAALLPSENSSDVTPLGVLKVGFVVPGLVPGLPPFGRGFEKVLWVWWAVTGVLCVGLMAYGVRKGPAAFAGIPATPLVEEAAVMDLAWLEAELEKEEKYFVDHRGESWRVLFDGTVTDTAKLQGQAYISEGELVLRPWGSSAIFAPNSKNPNYMCRVYARKIAGLDGFVMLFPCDNRFFSWVVGGWKNRRSEVAGCEGTSKDCRIEKGRWYQLDVRVGPEWVEGLVDDVPYWKMARADIRSSSPDVGFQTGLGVAVWNTLARYRDVRYRAL